VYWDVPHQRSSGFILQVLHHESAYQTLAFLADAPGGHPIDVARAVSPDDPEVTAASHVLSVLRRTHLVKRAGTLSEAGAHSGYLLTDFGAGLVGSVEPLAAWGMGHYGIEDPHDAVLAAGYLFGRRWSHSLMTTVVNAGPAGIEPGRAQAAVNELMAAIPEGTGHRLHPQPRHAALNDLIDNGLIVKRRAPVPRRPTRVLYSASPMGLSLMEALWPVAEWGIPYDAELSAFMTTVTGQ
jgi:DNA-binding HxlR family transcriptional regulator